MKTLDLTGNPCPIPVMKTKKELEKEEVAGVKVLVDNIVAVQNLKKMADGIGYSFSYTDQKENFLVTLGKEEGISLAEQADEPKETEDRKEAGTTVLITADQMGRGSEELGKILIKGFVFSLTELAVPPTAVIFLNSGVKLATEGSNVVEDLHTLFVKGSKIISCGTCLNYYALTDKLAAGESSDMFGITGYLDSAVKVITI